MICPERSTLLLWLDGELASSEAEAVSEHVENCDRCRGFVSAQKHIESVWRESWVDPPDSDFTTMRQVLAPVTPWWRTPGTWYIAAAICAAYIGVKIFYMDGAGTSLSSIVQQETSVESIPANEEQAGEEYPEEMIAPPVEEFDSSLEQEETRMEVLSAGAGEQMHSDQTVAPSPSGVGETELSDDFEESEYQEEALDILLSTANTGDEYLANHEESSSISAVEIADEESIFRSAASSGAVAAVVEGSLTAGGGGGGTAGFPQATVSDSSDEAIAENAVSNEAAEVVFGSPIYAVTATLESGEAITLGRDDWPSLFELIDTFSAKNSSSISEPFVIRVGSDGTVSGAIVPEGTVIDVPDERYGNCEVTVLFN